MKFSKLAQYLQQLESVSSRLQITEILASLLAEASDSEIDKIVYLSLGKLGPQFANTEFQIADKTILKSIALAYNQNLHEVRNLYKKLGDLGVVVTGLVKNENHNKKVKNEALSLFPKNKTRDLKFTVVQVYEQLLSIAQDSGTGSQDRKIQKLANLLRSVDDLSAKYIVRIPIGKLRLGFSNITILDALSWMVVGDKSLHSELENAYNVRADVGELAKQVKLIIKNQKVKIKTKKLKEDKTLVQVRNQLSNINIQLGTPIIVALCQRLKTFDDMIGKMGEVAIEPKYDGTRLQIHWKRKNNFIKTYTRNLEENSHMFPELHTLSEHLSPFVQEVIFDCEAIGYDPQTNKFLPFQITMTRKRKHGVIAQSDKVPIKFMIFDILYLKVRGQTLNIEQGDIHNFSLKKRRKILKKIIKLNKTFELVPQTRTFDPVVCRTLHENYLREGNEGVIVKKWSGAYIPGRKGWNWVKMKEIETARAGLADTLDCVVMGYYRGKGQRAKFGIGAFLVGVRGHVGAIHELPLLTISKIGTGITDSQFKKLHTRLQKLQTSTKPSGYSVHKNLTPDVWVKPSLVVEIAADNITQSKTHTSGYGLRFPRLVKIREDKSPEQASKLTEEVEELFKLQT